MTLDATTLAWLGGIASWQILYFFWKHFFSSYLTKKGANRADKEDIQHLTELVESVKHQFSGHLETQKLTNQLRLAALDKRLQAHQDAFRLWKKLFNAMHTPEIQTVVVECDEWWNGHCLYLEPAAREAFSNAYRVAKDHKTFLEESDRNRQSSDAILARWETFTDAPGIIIAAVALPGLTCEEQEEIAANKFESK